MGTRPVFALCPHIAAYVQRNASRWPFSVPGTAVRLTQEFLRETYELHHTPFYPISQVRKARHWRVLWWWRWFVYLPKSRDSNPTSLASESTLLPGMFH